MYYASIGTIALIVTTIVNLEALRKVEKTQENELRIKYRRYLIALIVYYLTDIAWGMLYELKQIFLTYIDTCIFFVAMASSVLLWTKTVAIFT